MTLSALPERLRDKSHWINTDQHVWYKWWWITFKLKYLSFSWRATEWWARCREYPIVLFAWFGEGTQRWESSDGEEQLSLPNGLSFLPGPGKVYLSRIQPWSRFAIYLSYPLFFHFHIFWKSKDVMVYPHKDSDHLTIKKYFEIAGGFKRDGDCYWLTAYIGGKTE